MSLDNIIKQSTNHMNRFWQQWDKDPVGVCIGFIIFCWGVSMIISSFTGK